MKKSLKRLTFWAATALVLPLAVSGCSSAGVSAASGSSGGKEVLKVAASATPHAELLNYVKPTLAKEGVDLQIITLSAGADGQNVLEQTEDGEYDVSYFAHTPYLEAQQAEKSELKDLVSAGGIHIEPIGLYSVKYKKASQLPDNATIAIPNDTSNEYRALKVLDDNGYNKLSSDVSTNNATVRSIVNYLKPIKLVEMDSQIIIRDRDQFDAYVTNTNKMIEAGLDATKYLYRESPKNNPFVNILIVKKSRKNDAGIKKLYAALTTQKVKQYIQKKYKGSVVAAF